MTYNHVSQHRYDVVYDNGVRIGELYQEVDGFFVFWSTSGDGFWEAHVLRNIADKLDELNAPWLAETQKLH